MTNLWKFATRQHAVRQCLTRQAVRPPQTCITHVTLGLDDEGAWEVFKTTRLELARKLQQVWRKNSNVSQMSTDWVRQQRASRKKKHADPASYVNMIVFRCPRVAWQFQTPICFPAMKQGLILDYKKSKKAFIRMSLMQESHWRYLFHKEAKSWDSTTWFRICQFQTKA